MKKKVVYILFVLLLVLIVYAAGTGQGGESIAVHSFSVQKMVEFADGLVHIMVLIVILR